ncbi:MAG: serine/threonine protein kinase [Polyangiaceae bacterium]|nr:serine/threonine protein kinase [Polyangiaceae bacterium]
MTDPAKDPFAWVGSTLNEKYRIESVIGEGGFGVVYLAHHLGFGAQVAVKCLRVPETLEGEQRNRFFESFLDEGRLLHRLSRATTGIVQALDVGAEVSPNGVWTPYLVLEWLDGKSLEADLEARAAAGLGGRSLLEAVSLLEPVARALAIAHDQGIAHRDIKPANLFLTDIAGRTTVKVLDFGIAKVLGDAVQTSQVFESTGKNLQAFTAPYGAPEQFSRRYGATGPWTDVFALALVLVELITGRRALEGSDVAELFVAAADPNHRPTLRGMGYDQAPEALETAIARALAIDPKARHRTAGEFWAEVLGALGLEPYQRSDAKLDSLSFEVEGGAPSLPSSRGERLQAATELSSSTGVPLAPPPSSALRPRTFVWVGVTAAGVGVASVIGIALLRQPGATASVPEPSAAASSAPPLDVAVVPPRETLLSSSPPRRIPSGSVPDEPRWIDEFKVQRLDAATGQPFADAQGLCSSTGMSLCTEAQWARACSLHPDLGRASSWTLSAHPAGFVVRGGAGCDVRAVAAGGGGAPDRGALCCDRAVAIKSTNPNRTFLTATAKRLLAVEAALNQRETTQFAASVAALVRVDGRDLSREELSKLLSDSFSRFPDQWFVLDSCSVAMQTPERRPGRPTPLPRKPPDAPARESAAWSAECSELRHRGGELSLLTVSYVFGGSGRLQSVRDVKSEPVEP